jgi:hypothetical protein
MALQPFWTLIITQSVGHLGWGISPSQGRYKNTEQYKHIINAHSPVFERAKTVHDLDRAATVIGSYNI